MKALKISKDVVTLAEFKDKAVSLLEQLSSSSRPLLITENGKPAGVLLSPEEFDRIQGRKSTRAASSVNSHKPVRRKPGTFLDPAEIDSIFKSYDKKNLIFPAKGRLADCKNADRYDEIIAIWVDYFNKKFNVDPPLHPNVVKALIGSESGFNPDPSGNKVALGIAQVTKRTLGVLQDPADEAKDFIFSKVRQKDLRNPAIAIPMAVRWLLRKRETAANKLNRAPNTEELILEYKGLLKGKSALKLKALENFKDKYEKLTS